MRLSLPAALVAALLFSTPLAAQENYEIQVYPSKTADKHSTLFELHSNFTGVGSKTVDHGLLPTSHAFHETLEITHGFSDIFELGFYIFTSDRASDGLQFVGTHLRPRVRAPDSWKLPVGLSLSAEFGPANNKFDRSEFGVELRPIIDQTLGNFYWSVNPAVGWSVKGPSAGQGLDGVVFAPNVKVAWTIDPRIAIGLEYYGTTGSLTRIAPMNEQQHLIYPSIDLFLSKDWETNIGVGVMVADSGDHNVLKLILGRRFGW